MILNVEGAINELTVLNVKLHTPFTAKIYAPAPIAPTQWL